MDKNTDGTCSFISLHSKPRHFEDWAKVSCGLEFETRPLTGDHEIRNLTRLVRASQSTLNEMKIDERAECEINVGELLP